MMPRRPVRFSLPGICARASDKGGPTPNFVSALRGQAEALPTAYVSELDDRTTRLGRATSYNMHGDGWSTCRRTPMEGEPMHGLDVESIFRGTGMTSTTCVHDTRVVRTHANGLIYGLRLTSHPKVYRVREAPRRRKEAGPCARSVRIEPLRLRHQLGLSQPRYRHHSDRR